MTLRVIKLNAFLCLHYDYWWVAVLEYANEMHAQCSSFSWAKFCANWCDVNTRASWIWMYAPLCKWYWYFFFSQFQWFQLIYKYWVSFKSLANKWSADVTAIVYWKQWRIKPTWLQRMNITTYTDVGSSTTRINISWQSLANLMSVSTGARFIQMQCTYKL